MKFKNKKVMAGMRAVAVISIISTTLFSSSYGIVLANEYSTQDNMVNHEYTHDNDSDNGSDFRYSDESKDDSHSEYSDSSEHDSYNHDDSDDSYHNSSDDNDDMDHSKNDNDHRKDHDKITICHATHSDSNPYVEITISIFGKDAHKHHQDKEDIIPAPKDGCPKGHGNHENHDGDDNHGGNDGDHDGDDNDNDGGHHENQNTAPIISLLGESTIYVYQGQTYTDQGATASDKEDGNITSSIVSISNIDTTKVGIYTVTYHVKDSKGACAETVTRTVIVKLAPEMNAAPVITLLGLNPIIVNQGDIYLDSGATANDKEDGNITSSIVTTGSVNTGVVGAYNIYYDVKDSKGLSAETVTRTVRVVDSSSTSTATIIATKIVCDKESDLPNLTTGGPGPAITSNTATDFLSTHPNCRQVDWVFEWSPQGTMNPGDNVLVGGGAWKPFTSIVSVPAGNKTWVREQFKSEYVPFTGVNKTQDVSAEMYCDTDVENYDNYDYISPTKAGKTYYCVAWNALKNQVVNNPPVITLIGSSTIDIVVGETFTNPGAIANDLEDGDITSSIVATGVVNTGIVGTYTVTYNVKDSKGLSAETVTRTVRVVEKVVESKRGKITFCLILANDQNIIATSSYALPQGTFTLSLASTSSENASTTIKTKSWDTGTFEPNKKAILNQNDSDCITYENLDYGIYLYSNLNVNGASWSMAQYNDQDTQPVNNVFDFFQYGNTNTNSDGYIILGENRYERTLYIYNTYKPASMCLLPEITSDLASSVKVNQNFTLALNASSTSSVNWDVATTSLPIGLSFATSTNTISGIPTVAGTYNIAIKATNTCGFINKTLVITVNSDTNGGGGTHYANLSVVKTANKGATNTNEQIVYTISLENKGPESATNVKVTDILPTQVDFVSASTSVGSYATSTGVWTVGTFANGSTTTLVIVTKVKAGTEGQNIANTATVTSDVSDNDASNNTSTVNINVINPNTNPAGGGGGGSTGGSGGGSNGPIVGSYGGGSTGSVLSAGIANLPQVQGCNYLLDYLRRDFNNNPYEVTKLQLFLINLEGFTNLKVTGVYDQATIDAVNVFQMRYKDDVLTPWGHTAPTSYTYILTKKKVNEIYCKIAFPVTADQQLEIDNYRNTNTNTVNTNVNVAPITNNEVGYGSNTTNTNTTNVSKSNSLNSIGYVKNSSTTATTSKVAKIATTVNDVTSNVANIGLTTLAGFSSSTKGLANDFVANIISSGKKIGSLLGALFSLPLSLTSKVNQNSCQNNLSVFSGLNLILVILIAVISYFWYREYRNNKKIEEINKEIDLQ